MYLHPEKVKVVVNDCAGLGKTKRYSRAIDREIRKVKEEMVIRIDRENTEKHGHKNAKEITKRAIQEGYDFIVGICGDGTDNEITNGMVEAEKSVPLAPHKGGIGNDLIHNANKEFKDGRKIPAGPNWFFKRLRKQGGKISEEDIVVIDVLTMTFIDENGKKKKIAALNGISLGADAEVNDTAVRWKDNRIIRALAIIPLVPKTIYVIAALSKILKFWKPLYSELRIDYNGKQGDYQEVCMIIANNGEKYGAVFYPAPGKSMRSGKMAICITKKMPRWKLVIGIILLMFGKHTLLREITMLETESATIRSRQPVYCQWDGEPWLLPPGEYKLEVLKQVLPVYIPSK